MSAEDDVELVLASYEAWNARGLEYVAEQFWHPDVEWEAVPEWPGDRHARGRATAVKEIRSGLLKAFGDFVVEVEDARQVAGNVLVAFRFVGRGTSSGVPVDSRVFQVVQVEDGAIVTVRNFFDERQAVHAAEASDG